MLQKVGKQGLKPQPHKHKQQDDQGQIEQQQSQPLDPQEKLIEKMKQLDLLDSKLRLKRGDIASIMKKTQRDQVEDVIKTAIDSVNTTFKKSEHQIDQHTKTSMNHSFSAQIAGHDSSNNQTLMKSQRLENVDANGNNIRGRRIDSPQLVVVRELRDQEDQDEFLMNASGLLLNEPDILIMKGYSSGNQEHYVQKVLKSQEKKSVQRRGNVQQVKSQEKKKNRSKQKYQRRMAQQNEEANDIVNIDLPTNQRSKSKVFTGKGTKSSREIRSSLGFNEILNHLDKDVSLQQSHQFDFKNRTTHDHLKLELSAIKRLTESGKKLQLHPNIQTKSQEKLK